MNNYTLVDYFNGFELLNCKHKLTPNVRSAWLAILTEFNKARFPDELEISIRQLQILSRIGCVSTAHEAKRVLKNIGAIDFKNRNGKTVYKLKDEHFSNSRANKNRTKIERSPNTAAWGSPLLLVPEDRPDSETERETAPAITKGGNTHGEGRPARCSFAIDARTALD